MAPALLVKLSDMTIVKEPVTFRSLGDSIAGVLFLPSANGSFPGLVVCHGAGEFKENYFELSEALAAGGVACLTIDMHGHGQSGGERFHVVMREWRADVQAAIGFLAQRPEIDRKRIGAFGLSSGGTAILEAAVVDSRLKALVVVDPTVRNSLGLPLTAALKCLILTGRIKRWLTKRELRLHLLKWTGGLTLASDPEVNRRLYADERVLEALRSFPLPGAAESIFVNTIQRVSRISAPTLIIWGEDDKLDTAETGRLLCEALKCRKELHVIPGNGHVGHLDRNRHRVFDLTAHWAHEHLGGNNGAFASAVLAPADRQSAGAASRGTPQRSSTRTILGEAARSLRREEKWGLLSPFLRQHGREALSYATLQEGMEYFLDDCGYIAFVTARHPVFARQPKRIVLCDPLSAQADYGKIIGHFLEENPRALFVVISEKCAETLRGMGFKANCIGYESELPIQTYNTQGNWKELDLIKRARNEARRLGIAIREENVEAVRKEQFESITARWIATKKVNDREIWFFARRPVFEHEEDVRKFMAYDQEGRLTGFAFYDPIYRDGRVIGYSDVISRCDEQQFGRLATAIHMVAMEQFKTEGKEVFNLNLAPFVKLDLGKYNDDWFMKFFFQLSARFGNDIYNFQGLSFHKSKYRGVEKPIYCASQNLIPSNDVYLAFQSADISRSYFGMLFQLLGGILKAPFQSRSKLRGAVPAGQ